MSDFDRDSLFDDDDDNESYDDFDDFDAGSTDDFDDDFDMGGDLGLDDDDDLTFDDDGDEFATTTTGGGNRPSPVFIGLAVVFIVILLVGLGFIAYLTILSPASTAEQTSTAVVLTNAEVALQIAGSETQSKIVMDITMTADAFTDTPAPSPTPSDTPSPTEDQSAQETAQFQATIDAADALATGTAIAATQTLGAQLFPTEVIVQLPTAIGAVTESPDVVGGAPQIITVPLVIEVGTPTVAVDLNGVSIGVDQPVTTVDGAPVIQIDGTPFTSGQSIPVILVDGTPIIAAAGTPIAEEQGSVVQLPLTIIESTPVVSVNLNGANVPIADGRPIIIINEAPSIQIDVTPFVSGQTVPVIVINGQPIIAGDGTPAPVGTSVADAGGGGTPINISAVQQTATALAALFNATPTLAVTTIDTGTGGGEPTPTREGALPVDTGGTGGETVLPDTGLFDDVFGGNPATIFAVAFGLLSVIVLSRSIRKRKK
jgi:hypothetical protein